MNSGKPVEVLNRNLRIDELKAIVREAWLVRRKEDYFVFLKIHPEPSIHNILVFPSDETGIIRDWRLVASVGDIGIEKAVEQFGEEDPYSCKLQRYNR